MAEDGRERSRCLVWCCCVGWLGESLASLSLLLLPSPFCVWLCFAPQQRPRRDAPDSSTRHARTTQTQHKHSIERRTHSNETRLQHGTAPRSTSMQRRAACVVTPLGLRHRLSKRRRLMYAREGNIDGETRPMRKSEASGREVSKQAQRRRTRRNGSHHRPQRHVDGLTGLAPFAERRP